MRTGLTISVVNQNLAVAKHNDKRTLLEGAPMMECKKALMDPEVTTIEEAIEWLRK